MTQPPLIFPKIPGLTWRPLRLDDAAGLSRLLAECGPVDGRSHLPDAAGIERELARLIDLSQDTLGVFTGDGRLAAYGWVQINDHLKNELRAFLDGRVHPAYRQQGIGSALLAWQERRAQAVLRNYPDKRPRILRADYFDRSADALRLFERNDFRFSLAEDTLNLSLGQSCPKRPLPADVSIDWWREETAPIFFSVYADAFRSRPGFPGWTEDVWRTFFTSYEAFRPDLSPLIIQNGTAVAYALVHVDVDGPWIVQMGTRQAYQRQGLAFGMLAELIRRFRQLGHQTAWIEVNVNNPSARKLYEQIGFRLVKRYTSYQKRL